MSNMHVYQLEKQFMQLQVSCRLAFVVLYLNNDPNITNMFFQFCFCVFDRCNGRSSVQVPFMFETNASEK